MADKGSPEDPVARIKGIASDIVDSVIDDLRENKLLNKQELQTLGKRVNFIVDKTETLIDDLTEKTQIVGKIVMKSFLKPKSQVILRCLDEIEDDESDSSESSASLTESEDESDESDESEESEEEENAESAQALALPIKDQKSRQDPVTEIKEIAHGVVNTFFEDLKEKKVLNPEHLQTLGKTVNVIVNQTENLVGDLTEKTQMVGKIFRNHFFKPKSQVILESVDENEDDESGRIKSSASLTVLQETQASQISVLKVCPCKHFQQPKMAKAHEVYPVMEKEGRTRLALIICNKKFDYLSERQGSEMDIFGMQDLLENLGYSVIIKENLTALEMQAELKHFAARPEHRFSDSTFLVFMSHGILDGICGTKHRDNEPDILHDDTIFQIFNNRNCRSLKDKPKVIIMQACRGRGDGAVWVTDVGEASACTYNQPLMCYAFSDAIEKTHVEKDFIAFKSSTPHNVSWRLNTNGSLFISQLIYYFKEYSCCHHLEEIFRKVQNSFETPNILVQMPTIERLSMTRYFYLFPGN